MIEEDFPCRTKTLSGTNYHVAIWRGKTKKGGPSGLTSFETEEQAKNFCESLPNNPYYEIKPNQWSRVVCIECGQDTF